MGGVQPPPADQSDQSDKDKLDDLEQMLSPNLDVDREIADVDLMLTRGLEQIDSKTVEDIFQDVLSTDQTPSSSAGENCATRRVAQTCYQLVNLELPDP